MLMSSAAAAPFESATVRRIIDGKEVYVDRQQAMVNDTANRGQQVSTGSSRTELLFDQRAIGFLGRNSLITLGQECFRLLSGQVLINGPQTSCLGSKVLGVRGTTYVLSSTEDGGYDLSSEWDGCRGGQQLRACGDRRKFQHPYPVPQPKSRCELGPAPGKQHRWHESGSSLRTCLGRPELLHTNHPQKQFSAVQLQHRLKPSMEIGELVVKLATPGTTLTTRAQTIFSSAMTDGTPRVASTPRSLSAERSSGTTGSSAPMGALPQTIVKSLVFATAKIGIPIVNPETINSPDIAHTLCMAWITNMAVDALA